MPSDHTPMFLPLTNLYEPSAIQQLPDGRFLVIEDEKQHPFSLLTIDPAGRLHSTPLEPALREDDDTLWKLDDLEGMVIDRQGNIYAATSPFARQRWRPEEIPRQARHGRRAGRHPDHTGMTGCWAGMLTVLGIRLAAMAFRITLPTFSARK